MKLLILAPVILLLLGGCRDLQEGSINYDFKTIDVEFLDSEVALSTDIIDSIEYIKLEDTEEPIGNVKKVIVDQEYVMLLDDSRKCIWIFSIDGKFIKVISRLGRGPGEYTSIRNFTFERPDRILINDWRSQAVKSYSTAGEFIDMELTDGFVSDYVKFNGMTCSFIYDVLNPAVQNYYFNVHGADDKIYGFFKYNKPFRFFDNGGDYILTGNQSLHLTIPYNDTIYQVGNHALDAKYVFNFGTLRYPAEELYNANSLDEIQNILGRENYVGNISNVFISDTHIVLNYSQQRDKYNANSATLIYNTQTNELVTYAILDRGTHDVSIINPSATDGSNFYSLKPAHQLPEQVMRNLSGTKGFNENSNPVLVRYKYKV